LKIFIQILVFFSQFKQEKKTHFLPTFFPSHFFSFNFSFHQIFEGPNGALVIEIGNRKREERRNLGAV